MKTLATQFVFCLLFSYALQALPSTLEEITNLTFTEDTTKKKILDGMVEINWDDNEDGYELCKRQSLRLGMVDLGISSYLTESGSLDMPEDLAYMDQRLFRSINLGIHIVNMKIGFHKRGTVQKFGISSGLKWNMVHYSMEKDYHLNRDAPDFVSAIDYEVPALKKNRLKANYIQVPIMLEFNSNPRYESQSFNIGIGYVHQLLLNSNYKYKTETGDKVKTKGGYNLTKSMGMIEGRIGYGVLNFYVQYGLKNLFQDNSDPVLTPINFGVNIIPR